MEPITILIYVAIIFTVIVGTLLSLVLIRLFRILSRVDHITNYVDQIARVVEMWSQLPVKLLQGFFERMFDKR